MPGPAYRIETPRLVARCWNPSDAPLLSTAIESSIEHLRPWLPWAHQEPLPADARVALLRKFRSSFDADENFVYGILTADESEVLGGTGLHPRVGERAREIGYWIRADRGGRGYATEATAALVRVAFEIDDVARIEIRCDPANAASAAIPRKLGFTHEGTLREQAADADGQRRDTMIWSLLASEYAASGAAALSVRAFDVCGRQIL